MKNIKDFTLDELKEEMQNLGEKPFRATQIFHWLYVEKVKSFDEMTIICIIASVSRTIQLNTWK